MHSSRMRALTTSFVGSVSFIVALGVQVATPATNPLPASGYSVVLVTAVDGEVRSEDGGRLVRVGVATPVLPGHTLRTVRGRLALRTADGFDLHVDRGSVLTRTGESSWWLDVGTVIVTATAAPAGGLLSINSTCGVSTTTDTGRYAVSVLGQSMELATWQGVGELESGDDAILIRDGHRSAVRCDRPPSDPLPFDRTVRVDVVRWADSILSSPSRQTDWPILPPALQAYGPMLDRAGSWHRHPAYGFVWHPRVPASWRPYGQGRWVSFAGTPRWVGETDWSEPTHHFGRWGRDGRSWFWVPGTTWAAAWVTWAVSPGLVAWCPLDVRDAPVSNPTGRDLFLANGAYDPAYEAEGWTVVPVSSFVLDGATSVHHGRSISSAPPGTPGTTWVHQRVAPSVWPSTDSRAYRIIGGGTSTVRTPRDTSTPASRAPRPPAAAPVAVVEPRPAPRPGPGIAVGGSIGPARTLGRQPLGTGASVTRARPSAPASAPDVRSTPPPPVDDGRRAMPRPDPAPTASAPRTGQVRGSGMIATPRGSSGTRPRGRGISGAAVPP